MTKKSIQVKAPTQEVEKVGKKVKKAVPAAVGNQDFEMKKKLKQKQPESIAIKKNKPKKETGEKKAKIAQVAAVDVDLKNVKDVKLVQEKVKKEQKGKKVKGADKKTQAQVPELKPSSKKGAKSAKKSKKSKKPKAASEEIFSSDDETGLAIKKLAGEMETDLNNIVSQSGKALDAMVAYLKKHKADSLFKDLPTRITMDVNCYKVPSIEMNFFNVLLPNPVYPPFSEILLVVQDDKKSSEDYQEPELKSSLLKQKLLMEHGIKIREVLTFKQLISEYSTQEAKRKLIQRVDAILVDKPIIKYMPKILGREMYRRKKFPMAINFAAGHNLTKEIAKVLRKTVLPVSNKGQTSTVVVGTDELKKEELKENINNLCVALARKFPGGWANIAKLHLCIPQLPPFPVHVSLASIKDVKKCVKKFQKRIDIVEDEVNTVASGKLARVYPDGTIKLVGKSEKDE